MQKIYTAADKRKDFLISKLNKLGIYQKDNRHLETFSLYELEWLHIEVLNKYADEEFYILWDKLNSKAHEG